jgi:hypothetical protein
MPTKPIKRPTNTIIYVFDSTDDETYQKVTTKSAYRMNKVMERLSRMYKYKDTGHSFRIDMVMYSSKYNKWAPPI